MQNKINIRDNIPRYLQGEVKLLTTPCVVIEMEKLGHKLLGALKILKNYPAHKCTHKSKPVTGSECLISMLGDRNEKHYLIATQDRDLQTKLRTLPAVPILYLHGRTPVLEEPSQTSYLYVKDKMSGILKSEQKTVDELKEIHGLLNTDTDTPKKKKKKKGPNPLSCKKKKQKRGCEIRSDKNVNETNRIQKNKRKKIRIPEHVKCELIKNKHLNV